MTSMESYFDQRVEWDEAQFLYKTSRYKPNQAIAKSFDWINWQNKRVLEIGCGQGYYSIPLARRAKSVLGIDLSQRAITYAQQAADNIGINNVSFEKADLLTFGAAAPFDVIVSITVLMHIPDLPNALGQIYKLLKPGGLFLLSEPNKHYPALWLTAWRKAQSPVFSQRFSLAQLRQLLAEQNFTILRESGRIFSIYPTRRTEALIFLSLERWAETKMLKERGEHIVVLAQKG